MKHTHTLLASFLTTSAILGALALSARADDPYETADLQPLSDPSEDPLLARMRSLFEQGFNGSNVKSVLKTARYACASRSIRSGDFKLDDSIFFLVDIIPGAYQMMAEEAVAAVYSAHQSRGQVIYNRTELVENTTKLNTFDTILIANGEMTDPNSGQRTLQTKFQRSGVAATLNSDMFVIEWLTAKEEEEESLIPVITVPVSPENLSVQPDVKTPTEQIAVSSSEYTVAAISKPEKKTAGYTFCSAIPEELQKPKE